MKSFALIAMTAVMAATAASSATQLVVNGNFTELSNGLGQLGYNTTATGWSTSGFNFVMSKADVGASGQYSKLALWDSTNYTAGTTGSCGSYTCSPVGNTWNGEAPNGGNFVALDGDYETAALTQTITGLTVGQTYYLSFEYAFGQQVYHDGNTVQYLTETLGGQSFTSPTFDVPSHGFTGWQSFGEKITATATTETLSFLAHGNIPVPPFAMVSDVSLTVPEPASWTMMILGIGALGALSRRRRASAGVSA